MAQRAQRVCQHPRKRTKAQHKLYGRRWQKWSRQGLIDEPLCRFCAAAGQTVAATVRDHIIPHRGDLDLFWNPANIQSLCKPCHDRKTLIDGQ